MVLDHKLIEHLETLILKKCPGAKKGMTSKDRDIITPVVETLAKDKATFLEKPDFVKACWKHIEATFPQFSKVK